MKQYFRRSILLGERYKNDKYYTYELIMEILGTEENPVYTYDDMIQYITEFYPVKRPFNISTSTIDRHVDRSYLSVFFQGNLYLNLIQFKVMVNEKVL